MAKVNTAYVEIQPDLTGFQEALETKLKAIDTTMKLKIEADTTSLDRVQTATKAMGKKATADLENQKQDQSRIHQQYWNSVRSTELAQLNWEQKLQDDYSKLFVEADRRTANERAKVEEQAARDHLTRQDAYTRLFAEADRRNAKAEERDIENDLKRRLSIEASYANLFDQVEIEGHKKVSAEKERIDKADADRALAYAKAAFGESQALLLSGEKERERISTETNKRITADQVAQQSIRTRYVADSAADQYRVALRKMKMVSPDLLRDIELDLQSRFGSIGAMAGRKLATEFNSGAKRNIDANPLAKVEDALDKFSGSAATKVAGLFKAFSGAGIFGGLVGVVGNLLGKAIDNTISGVRMLLQAVRKGMEGAGDLAVSTGSTVASSAVGTTTAIIQSAVAGTSELVEAGVGGIAELGESAAAAAGEVGESVIGAASETAEATLGAIEELGAGAAGAVEDAARGAARAGETAGNTLAEMIANAVATGGMSLVTGALLLLAAGLATVATAGFVAVAALGVLQLALGVVLTIVIPLVAGITALVAEVLALGAALVGSLGLIPGLAGAALAAFGPLMLVMDRFQALFENTAQHTGELFAVMEHLKNAIYAVMSTGLIEAIQGFVKGPLHLLFTGLIEVSAAWNRFFLALVKVGSQTKVLAGMNTLFSVGAQLIDLMATSVTTLAPALLTMATEAAPALSSIMDSLGGVVGWFGDWVTQMASSGQMSTFFAGIAQFLRSTLNLIIALVPLATGFIHAIMPGVQSLMSWLGIVVTRWSEWVNSGEGQAALMTFFDSMNSILMSLQPALEAFVSGMVGLGPALAEMVGPAGESLKGLINTLFRIGVELAPDVELFLARFNALMSDPKTQASIGGLVDALGDLLVALSNVLTADTLPLLITFFEVNVRIGTLLIGVLAGITEKLLELAAAAKNPVAALILGLTDLGAKAGLLPKRFEAVGDAGKAGTDAVGRGITGLANSGSWSAIMNRADLTADYLINMSNNGIDAIDAVSNSMATLAATSYAKKDEAGQLTFEKHIGKVMPKFTQHVTKTQNKSGKDAANTWTNAYGAALTSKSAAAAAAASKAGKTIAYNTAAGILTNIKPALAKLDWNTIIKGGKAYDTAKEVGGYIAKGLTSGAANIAQLTKFLTGKKGITKALNAVVTAAKNYNASLTFLGKDESTWQGILSTIQNFKQQAIDTLTSRRDLVGWFGFIPTGAEVTATLNDQLTEITKFRTNIDALLTAGIKPEIVAKWAAAGPETAGNIVEGLQNATPEIVTQVNSLYDQIGAQATGIAARAGDAMTGYTEAQVQSYITTIQTSSAAMATALQKALNDAVIAGSKSMKTKIIQIVPKDLKQAMNAQGLGIGKSTIDGYIKGLNNNAKAAETALQKIMDNVVKKAKQQLGQKSPSTVFADIGTDTMLGYIIGVQDQQQAVVDSVGGVYADMIAQPTPVLGTPTLAAPGLGLGLAANTMPPSLQVKVYLGTRELTDIVRTEVSGIDSTRARELLSGRRGG
jgi:hypothetical protein